jgi:hypothetical protein
MVMGNSSPISTLIRGVLGGSFDAEVERLVIGDSANIHITNFWVLKG